jgi:hypothetical protein
MPGSVSDSYDPEFGTGENADDVRGAVKVMLYTITHLLGTDERLPIVDVIQSRDLRLNRPISAVFRERDLRVIWFAIDRALESL